ncbi:MAG: hypothetical protein ACRD88_01105, partial [Terriglobia bacterium]
SQSCQILGYWPLWKICIDNKALFGFVSQNFLYRPPSSPKSQKAEPLRPASSLLVVAPPE